MANDYIKTLGIVLGKHDISDIDVGITIYTDECGLIDLIVPGIKKTRRREIAAIDILNLTNFVLRPRKDKYVLHDFTLVDSYRDIKSDYQTTMNALGILSILKVASVSREPNRRIFVLTHKTLEAIGKTRDTRRIWLIMCYYILKHVENLGILPSHETLAGGGKTCEIVLKLLSKDTESILGDTDKYSNLDILDCMYFMTQYIEYHLGIQIKLKKYIMEEI